MCASKQHPENVFDWLDQIQRRPGMYLGATAKPLDVLQTLVHGYTAALRVHGVVENVPSMDYFSTWLRHKTRWSTSCGWASAISEHAQQDLALEDFFSLVAEFRALVPTVLCSALLSERNEPRGVRDKAGDDFGIVRPDQIDVVRYMPEPIHFLRFHYGERLADQHALYTGEGSYSTTLDRAKDWVRDEFAVEHSEWRER